MLETIAAISSGYVNQAISIIRIVGPEAVNIIKKIFTGKIGPNKTIQYGFIKDGKKIIDEVLVNFFIGKDNFIGEDTIEINAHGGIVVSQKILDIILAHGARIAKNGEFTRRAYLNGKISLIKAEAINDLINAKTSKQQEIAINSFDKKNEENIKKFISDVEYLIGLCEVNIDYPEYDDVPILDNESFSKKLILLMKNLEKIIKSSESNQVFINPISIAIVGNPNVGKSSLMNAILNTEKSIVTNIPGTTRDVVESEIVFNNFILKFKDTAGIRKSSNEIEKIGIEKTWNEFEKSDIIFHVIDSTKGLTEYDNEIIKKVNNKKYIQLWNKSDLISKKDKNKIYISSINKEINNLNKALNKLLIDKSDDNYNESLFNKRQISCLKKSFESLKNANESIKNGYTYDVVITDLHECWESLKEILGDVNKEELLDSIFKNFCLGK